MQKKIIIMMLFIFGISYLTAQIPGDEPGDVNGDGRLTVVDSLMLIQYTVGISNNGIIIENADMNQDGEITYADAICLYTKVIMPFLSCPQPGSPDTTPGTGVVSLTTGPYQPHLPEQEIYVKVVMNTGSQIFWGMDINIHYDSTVLEYSSVDFPFNISASTVAAGNDIIRLRAISSATSTAGAVHIATLSFRVVGSSEYTTEIFTSIRDLIDASSTTIGNPGGDVCEVNIIPGLFGDVNEDGVIDIVDALILARCYVSLCGIPYSRRVADVDNTGTINIVDALIIAQHYVGLIDKFPVEEYLPEAIPDI